MQNDPKIRHEAQPIPVSEVTRGPQPVERQPQPVPAKPSKIKAFDQKLGGRRHEDNWTRTPNTTGTGAIHVKSFHCRLSEEGLAFLDQAINEWLDAHPQYEVKFVQTSIGEWKSKTTEQNLVVQVWV